MKSAKVESSFSFDAGNRAVFSMKNDEALQPDERGVRLCVHLQPGAKRTQWAGRHGDALKLKVQAPPVEGAANKAATKLLAETFGVAKSQVELLRGKTSREKVFLIRGVSVQEAAKLIRNSEE
jgi:uncharacterized protein (TIGR00251 family)